MAKQTGYFIEDYADIMERLSTGTATKADQHIVFNALEAADVHADVYTQIANMISPMVVAEPMKCKLPASVVESFQILLEFWQLHCHNPLLDHETIKLVRHALSVGAHYSLAPCVEALAKVNAGSTAMVPGKRGKNTPNSGNLAPGFPARLTKARLEARITVEQLAKRINVQNSIVERYESGLIVPQSRLASRIVKALQADENYLLFGIESEQRPIGVSSVKKATEEGSK
jgi:DNA-binding XRE family transcriptional regulator